MKAKGAATAVVLDPTSVVSFDHKRCDCLLRATLLISLHVLLILLSFYFSWIFGFFFSGSCIALNL